MQLNAMIVSSDSIATHRIASLRFFPRCPAPLCPALRRHATVCVYPISPPRIVLHRYAPPRAAAPRSSPQRHATIALSDFAASPRAAVLRNTPQRCTPSRPATHASLRSSLPRPAAHHSAALCSSLASQLHSTQRNDYFYGISPPRYAPQHHAALRHAAHCIAP